MPSCFGHNAQGCQSGINQILIYIPASHKCHLTCHPVCMQLPMNASLVFFGFIMYYSLLDGHVGFWQSHPFIHFAYNLLSERRNYVFLCRLAVKCYFLNKLLYSFIHFWNLTQFYRFLAAILDLAAILNLFTVIMVHYISLAVFFT